MFETTLMIDGMACGMCEAHINESIRKNFKIKKMKTSHTRKESIIISSDVLDEAQLKRVVEESGYRILSITVKPYTKKGLFRK